MEEIINQIIANRNYHMLSDEQVEAMKKLLKSNKVLAEMVDEKDNKLSKIQKYIEDNMDIDDNPTICGDEPDTITELPISLSLYNEDLRELLDLFEISKGEE